MPTSVSAAAPREAGWYRQRARGAPACHSCGAQPAEGAIIRRYWTGWAFTATECAVSHALPIRGILARNASPAGGYTAPDKDLAVAVRCPATTRGGVPA
ncbi:MAG: hypothetical protein JWM27_67 [Gemmatimonadetes bacterium]|nr:hypothetical protein [Gemmatimonadota bacterium]